VAGELRGEGTERPHPPVGRFEYNDHLDGMQVAQLKASREAFIKIGAILEELLPLSREKSLAFTKLEEAANWANKAITHN
jgi:hypothetical protein